MARLADGDPQAFDAVFEGLWPVLRRYCAKTLGSGADGQDAAQRALLKVFENAADYDPSRPALSWALSFAYWQCKSELRVRQRSRESGWVEGVSDSDPESLLADKQQREVVQAALAELSASERALVLQDLAQQQTGHAKSPAERKQRQRLLARLRHAAHRILFPKGARS